MSNLKYTYALDETKTFLVHLDDARKGEVYYCPYSKCGERLIIKEGGDRRKHFSHIGNSGKCSYDNYLHSLAEMKIAEWFNTPNSITFELNTDFYCANYNNCIWKDENRGILSCLKQKLHLFYLKKFYNHIEVEKSENGFIWDLLLTNTTKNYPPTAIEIHVTHKCDENKLNSGYRIVEIKIENEEQLEALVKSNKLIESEKITFHNFNRKPQYEKSVEKLKLNKFIIYESNRAAFKVVDCNTFLAREHKSIYELTFDYYENKNAYGKIFNAFYLACAKAYSKYPDFKHCSLCQFYKYNEYYNQHICCLYKSLNLKDKHEGTNALTCPKFCLNRELVKERIECFSKLSIYEWAKKTNDRDD